MCHGKALFRPDSVKNPSFEQRAAWLRKAEARKATDVRGLGHSELLNTHVLSCIDGNPEERVSSFTTGRNIGRLMASM